MSLNLLTAEQYAAIGQGWCPQCRRKTVISRQSNRSSRTQILCHACGWSLATGNTADFAAAEPARIPQHLLVKLLHWRGAQNGCDALREYLMNLVDRNAAIEPGVLSAEIRDCNGNPFTKSALQTLLGIDETEAIKNRLPQVETQQLLIVPSLSISTVHRTSEQFLA